VHSLNISRSYRHSSGLLLHAKSFINLMGTSHCVFHYDSIMVRLISLLIYFLLSRQNICIFCLLFVCFVATQNQKDCSKILGLNGDLYDLTPLVGKSLETTDGFSSFKVVVCQNTQTCGGCTSLTGGYCQTNEFFTDCIGKFAGGSPLPDSPGVLLLYDQGDYGNTGQVKIKCNPTATTITKIVGEQFNKVTTCESMYACPSKQSLISTGTVIMIVVIVVIVIYFGAGIAWNKFREQKDGVELIPNIEFWKELPGLVKDGVLFVGAKVSGHINGGQSDGL